MMLLNTQLATNTTLTANAVIPIGSVLHKYGCAIYPLGNSIRVDGAGYFRIIANVTVEPTAVADMTVTLLDNGNEIASATGAPAVAGDPLNLTLIGMIYNKCGCAEDTITLEVNSAGTVTEMDVIVERM